MINVGVMICCMPGVRILCVCGRGVHILDYQVSS